MNTSVDVIVPVFGNWLVTRTCLESLATQTLPHRVIVVDDASPDETLERLAAEYPHIDVVTLEQNSGFAAACNRGLASATADIVVLFNNDVEANPTMLERLVVPFDDPQIGSSTPLLFQPDGRIDAFGLAADVTMAGFLRLHGASVEEAERPGHRLLGPYGAVAAYRKTALSEVGLLDEGIFMYGEELDLALRLSAAGWKPGAAVDAKGIHLGGATSGRGTAWQRRRAGFGRGYLLRAYGIVGSAHGLRALLTELVVCVGDLLLSGDLSSTRGRLEGWRAGRTAFRRSRSVPDVDRSIAFFASLRLRIGSRT